MSIAIQKFTAHMAMWCSIFGHSVSPFVCLNNFTHDLVRQDKRSGNHGGGNAVPNLHCYLPNPVGICLRVAEHLEEFRMFFTHCGECIPVVLGYWNMALAELVIPNATRVSQIQVRVIDEILCLYEVLIKDHIKSQWR